MGPLRPLVSLSLFSLVCAASPLLAQPASTMELGASGGYTFFDSDLPFADRAGGGGFLTFFFFPRVSIEGETFFAATEHASGEVLGYMPIRIRLMYSQPLFGGLDLLLGSGFLQNIYFFDAGEAADDGFTGTLGLRLALSRAVALRVAGNADYTSDPVNPPAGLINPASETWSWGVQAGFSVRFGPLLGGGRRTLDLDGDGIAEADDACPGTLVGVPVDRRGCALPQDADGDGVADDADDCAGTAAGVGVDARGCPLSTDADDDGVEDARDECPGTAAGRQVDARGCPLPVDSDADGVADDRDACPATPAGATVDERGCPPAPLVLDADGDGVMDASDACPATPSGVAVDTRGCPVPVDSDGDGVTDARDACPATPAGAAVDARGCPPLPEPAVEPAPDQPPPVQPAPVDRAPPVRTDFAGVTGTVVLEGVEFVNDETYELSAGARAELDGVAEWLIAHPDARIEIAAHTDNSEFRSYALIRSLGRANAVRKYLVARGASGSRLFAKGYGPDQPVASNETAAGRAQNNRIELRRQP